MVIDLLRSIFVALASTPLATCEDFEQPVAAASKVKSKQKRNSRVISGEAPFVID
jgi:hypothetical protein